MCAVSLSTATGNVRATMSVHTRVRCGRGASGCFDRLAEESTRIFGRSDRQLWLHAAKGAYLINDAQVTSQVAAKKFSGLAPHTGCVGATHEHNDLHDAPHASHVRSSLALSTKKEVDQNLVHFGVARTYGAHLLRGMPGVFSRYRLHHIDDADPWRRFVRLPNPHGLSAQQCCQLLRNIVSRGACHGTQTHAGCWASTVPA